MSEQFHEWYRKNADFFDDQTDEEMAEIGWRACKKEILKLLKQHQLGVGNYGNDGEIEGVIHRLEVLDKIRKL